MQFWPDAIFVRPFSSSLLAGVRASKMGTNHAEEGNFIFVGTFIGWNHSYFDNAARSGTA
jgi:hypothetical protein